MYLSERAKNIIIFSSLLIVSFIALEIMVRSDSGSYCKGYIPSKNDRIVYELKPNFGAHPKKTRISSQGLNDRYFSVEKPSDVYRIAVLGDSTSYGWKIKREQSFPKVLERMLNERKKRRYEVINFSVPGYNISQEYEVLKEKVLKFNPDAVILSYCGNDINLCNFIKSARTPLNFLYRHSYYIHRILRGLDRRFSDSKRNNNFVMKHIYPKWLLFKKKVLGMFYYDMLIYHHPGLERTMSSDRNPPSIPELVPDRYHYMLGTENYRIHLSNIVDMLKRHDIRLVSCGFFHRWALAVNRELGVEKVLDFNEVFPDGSIYWAKFAIGNGDRHMNPEGHALAAQSIYDSVWGGVE